MAFLSFLVVQLAVLMAGGYLAAAEASEPEVRLHREVTFWVEDENGDWKIPLPNWSVSDIMKCIESHESQTEDVPYAVQSINATGRVEGTIARLKLEYRITTIGPRVVRVPLFMKEGVYIPEEGSENIYDVIKYTGGGTYHIEYDEEVPGYVAVIDNRPSQDGTLPSTHTLTLTLCFPVETFGNDEYRFAATFPPAVHSKVRLVVPVPDIELRASSGVLAMPPMNLNESTSEIVLNGLNRTGEVSELFWHHKEGEVSQEGVIIQVENAEITAVPQVQDTQFTALLPIRTYGGAVDTFRISLPRGATLVPDSVVATGLSGDALEIRDVREVTDESMAEGEATVHMVEVSLARRVEDGLTLQLKAMTQPSEATAELARELSASPEWELGGFAVLNAQKQSGHVLVRFPEDLNYKMTPSYGVRLGQDGTESASQEQHYDYFAQPFSLRAQVIVRQTRIRVKPEYQVQVQQGQVELQALCQYTVHGSKVGRLAVQIGDWIISNVKSNYNISTDKIYTDTTTGELVFPLAVPADGQIELTFTAVRDIAVQEGLLEFSLPVPVADWVEPAPFIVVPDDNIELIPNLERLARVRARSLRSMTLGLELPVRQQSPQSWQIESRERRAGTSLDDDSLPHYAASVRFRSRQTTVVSQTDAFLFEKEKEQIQQNFQYTILYEPLESLSLLVPEELRDFSGVRVSINGKAVAAQKIVTDAESEHSPFVRKRIMLSEEPLIGNANVTLVYSCKPIELLPQMSNKLSVQFIEPEDGTLTSNTLAVHAPAGIGIEYHPEADSNWKMSEGEPAPDGEMVTWKFTSRQREAGIVLRGILDARDVLGTTVVERSWVQTWLVGSSRLDRLACRIISDQPSVRLQLPHGARPDRVSVAINGVPWYGRQETSTDDGGRLRLGMFDAAGLLVIPIAGEHRLKPLTVEISYLIDRKVVPDNTFEFPQFSSNSVWVQRSYWQVIVPSNEQIVGETPGWTAEYYSNLVWSGLFWRRQASMNQDDLCTWVGVGMREPIPAETNCYLFSSFNEPDKSSLVIVSRAFLILIGSGLTLLTGLCFIYFPMFRYRGTLLFMVILLAGICSWRPLATLLFLQTTIFGIILTVLTVLLAKVFDVRTAPVGERIPAEVRQRLLESRIPSQGSKSGSKLNPSSLWVEETNEREGEPG